MQVGYQSSVREALKNIYRTRGFRGCYAGFWSFVWRETPFSAIQMPVYELLKRWCLGKNRTAHDLTFGENAKNGAISGIVGSLALLLAGFMTNPVDVIKTRMMTNRDEHGKSMSNTFKSLWNEAGVLGMLKGAQIRVLYISFASVLFFCSYEPIKRELSKSLNKPE